MSAKTEIPKYSPEQFVNVLMPDQHHWAKARVVKMLRGNRYIVALMADGTEVAVHWTRMLEIRLRRCPECHNTISEDLIPECVSMRGPLGRVCVASVPYCERHEVPVRMI